MAGTWTYDPAQLATSQLYQVRNLIADTNYGDQLLFDQEVQWFIDQRKEVYGAAADACRRIAAKYSRDIDTVQGDLHRLYSARQKAYADRGKELDDLAKFRGPGVPYAGGTSRSDKRTQEANSDRVSPNFTIGMTDNWQPVPPVGPETQDGGPDRGSTW